MIGWTAVLLLKLTAGALILFLMLGWFQDFHPAFDSFSHFRQPACLSLFLVTMGLLFVAPLGWAASAAATLVVSLALSYPYLPGFGPPAQTTENADTLKVMQLNLRFNNDEIDTMAKAILSEDADVVLLQELTPLNFSILDKVKEKFPYQFECNSRSSGSVGLLSRHRFAATGRRNCLRKLGFIHARLQIGSRQVTVAGLHSKWPWPQRQYFQFGKLETTIGELQHPLIVAGDFNAAPWSAAVHRIAGFSKTTVLHGSILSWKPAFKGRRILTPPLLTLDQIMASGEFVPVARRRLQDGGSDHLPILTEFVWRDEDQTS